MPDRKGCAILYYYFDYLKAGEQHPDLVSATFLKQLAEHFPLLPPQIEELHDRLKKLKKRPDRTILMPIILSLLESFGSTFIVIDALDECVDDYRNDISEIIAQLQMAAVRIFATTRPHIEYTNRGVSQWTSLEIRAHEEDIRRLFNHKLEGKAGLQRIMRADLQEEIVVAIVSKAQGMYVPLPPIPCGLHQSG